ncbi:MAG: hypothetical protein AB7R00_20935 [Kofleriaceae bacterium]
MASPLRARVAAIPALAGKYAELSVDELEALGRRAIAASCVACHALENLDNEGVRAVLRSSSIAGEQLVAIVWASYRFGITLPFELFAAWFDDLWFPSAEDVIVAVDGEVRLILDHEEQLSVMASDPQS